MAESNIPRRRLLQTAAGGLAVGAAGCFNDTGNGDGNGNNGNGGGNGPGTSTDGYNVDEIHILTDYNSENWQNRWENDIVPPFTEATGVDVRVEYAGRTDATEQRLSTLLQSGTPPNGYQASIAQSMSFVTNDQVSPVTDILDEWNEQFGTLTGRNTITFGGEGYMVPHGVYLISPLQYRADIYEELGLEEPETWDDLVENARAIDEADQYQARGYSVSGTNGTRSEFEFRPMLNCAGVGYYRWTDDSREDVEVWFPEDEVVAVLEHMEELKQYSTDPSSNTYNQVLNDYASGRVAQTQMINVYAAGIASVAGADSIAENTEITLQPARAGVDPAARGWAQLDGAVVWNTEGQGAMKDFYRSMYESQEKFARNHVETEPTRFFPPYREVTQTDAYRNADLFSRYDGHIFDLVQECYDEIAPTLEWDERPVNAVTQYAFGKNPSPVSQMLNEVLVQGRDKAAAHQECRSTMQDYLAEGKEAAQQFE